MLLIKKTKTLSTFNVQIITYLTAHIFISKKINQSVETDWLDSSETRFHELSQNSSIHHQQFFPFP